MGPGANYAGARCLDRYSRGLLALQTGLEAVMEALLWSIGVALFFLCIWAACAYYGIDMLPFWDDDDF